MKTTPAPKVIVLMGSKSDWDVVRHARDTVQEFGIPVEARVLSAHRTPGPLLKYLAATEAAGAEVYICAAGAAAHLAGVVAGHTTKPVLGIPMTSQLDGLDSLLSTVQMPGGIPVATFAIGKAGAINAGLFAVAMLALKDAKLGKKLQAYRDAKAKAILAEKLD